MPPTIHQSQNAVDNATNHEHDSAAPRGAPMTREGARLAAHRGRGTSPALQPRGERADQVAQDRPLAEDRRGVEPAHSGGGMMIRGVTLAAVLLVSLLAAPLAADAQQAGKVPRIGFLSLTSPSDRPHLLDAFRQRLRELGWVEGQNIVIDYRYAEDRVDRLPDLAAELVRLKVDLIVASAGTQAATAAKNATETIPIVMIYVRDPVGTGLIASLARPGGNVTGVSGSAGLEMFAKQLELLKRPSPRSAVWPSSRTRTMRTTSSRYEK